MAVQERILRNKTWQDLAVVFNKTIIPLALVGYEMIIANSATRLVGYLSCHIQRALVEKLLSKIFNLRSLSKFLIG